MTTKSLALATVVLALVVHPGCRSREAGQVKDHPEKQFPSVQVEAIWTKNEKIMQAALSGKGYSVEEFGKACDFFEHVTGIPIRGNGSYFGWLANDDTAADFQRVQKWYLVNRDRLYWDEASKSVKVRKQ